MLGLFAQLLSGLAAAATPAPTATCNVGLAALRDLPPVGTTQGTVDTYFDLDPSHHGLAEACPSVRENLPAGYAVADAAAWARANVHAPIPGKFTSPAFIYQSRYRRSQPTECPLRSSGAIPARDCAAGALCRITFVRLQAGNAEAEPNRSGYPDAASPTRHSQA